MSYQADPENLNTVEVKADDEIHFFSSTNKLRMLGLFTIGAVATFFAVASKGTSQLGQITMLNKNQGHKPDLSKLSSEDILRAPTTVEGMLAKYGLKLDRSKMRGKKYASKYGKYTPKKNPIWGAPSHSYFYVMEFPDTDCALDTPYSVMGMALDECMPLGASTDDDYTSQMGVVITCSGSITLNIYQDQQCSGDALYSIDVADTTDTCYSGDSSGTYVTCTPMDFSAYAYGIEKIWISAGADNNGKSAASHDCAASTDATSMDSEMFIAYPANNCIPEAITGQDYSYMIVSDNANPAVAVYEDDNCEGDSFTIDLDPDCTTSEVNTDIYESMKYQFTPMPQPGPEPGPEPVPDNGPPAKMKASTKKSSDKSKKISKGTKKDTKKDTKKETKNSKKSSKKV